MITTEQYQVIFNDNDLSGLSGLDLYNHNFMRLPNRDIKIYKIARESLSIITSAEYTTKEVTVNLEACGGSRQETETVLETMKGIVQVPNGELKVLQGGVWYSYTATLNEFSTEFDGAKAIVTLTFIASTPIGESVEDFSLFSMTGVTTASSSYTFSVGGSAEAKPLITITITSKTGTGTITVINARTGQGITLDEAFADDDIIEIISATKSVTRNGSEIDFTGIFPVWGVGTQQVEYSDTFTTRSVDVTATYNKRVI